MKRLSNEEKVNDSLNLSIKEGAIASLSTNIGSTYVSPFAIFMNATASQVGLLFAIVSLIPSISQFFFAKILGKYSRKKIALTGIFAQATLWGITGLMAYLYFAGIKHVIIYLIIISGIFYATFGLGHLAWFSWMGSLVPKESRGRYFSKRNRVVAVSSILGLIIGAEILDYFKGLGTTNAEIQSYTLIGFGAIFFLAGILRAICGILIAKQYEPKTKIREKDFETFKEFLGKALKTPFGRFTIYRGIHSIAIGVSGAYWAVYMLRNLGFSYTWFMIITVSVVTFQIIFLPLMGRLSDRYGNISIMRLCAFFTMLIPFSWYLSSFITNDFWLKTYLIFVPQLLAGFGWAGFNLTSSNYVYDAVGTKKLGIEFTYLNMFVGFGMFIGAMIGSLISYIEVDFMNTILFIFLVSGILRIIAGMIGHGLLKEVREVETFSPKVLLDELHPIGGVMHEVRHLQRLVNRVEQHV